MKHLIIVLFSLGIFLSNLCAQESIEQILSEIELNNSTISALRKSAEAEKIGNKTGIFLQNPEVEFNYLWGNPNAIGNRTDLKITQAIDFPTAYKYKNQISNIKNEQVELEYQKQLRTILLQAHLICCDIVYTNALKKELIKRQKHAESTASSYKSKYEIGETNILEFNKAQLNLLNINKKLELIEVDRVALIAELSTLNGGKFIKLSENRLSNFELPIDFEEWYTLAEQNNPVLNWIKQEILINQKQEQYYKAMSLPKFQAGYMSEKVIGEQFQGLSVSLSIPLWENKNTVKLAKTNSLVIESINNDNKLQFYNRLKALHARAVVLQKSANDYRLNLISIDNSSLLEKALDKGEITMIEYMVELSIYYESMENLLEIEKDINKTIAELNQYM